MVAGNGQNLNESMVAKQGQSSKLLAKGTFLAECRNLA